MQSAMKLRRNLRLIGIILTVMLIVGITPQVYVSHKAAPRIYTQLDSIPATSYALVFGTTVNPDGTLSDITRERIGDAILLYQRGKVHKLFISADERHNHETQVIAMYARQHGVAARDIITDDFGIDTEDSCRHFSQITTEGILITQGFHLPRAMLICERYGLNVTGLAAENLDLLSSRGDDTVSIYATRLARFTKEAALTWAYVTGLYSRLSDEAELAGH
jgi:vancomycin permeability regulator SanA